MTPSPNPTHRRVWHWLALPLMALLLAVCLIVLQNARPDAAGVLFVLLIAGSALIGLEASTHLFRQTARFIRRVLRRLTAPLRTRVITHRERIAPLAAFGALVLFIIGAILLENISMGDDALIVPFVLLLVGLALWGFALLLKREALVFPGAVQVIQVKSRRVNIILLALGLFVLAALTEANADILHIEALRELTTDAQFGLLCAGLALVTLGLGGVWFAPIVGRATLRFLKPSAKTRRVPRTTRLRLEFFLPIGVVLLAFGLRFWHLHDANRIFVDELNHVAAVNDLFHDAYTALIAPFSSIAAFPYLFPYGQKFAVELFGHNYLGIRAFSAVIGTLTVAAVYRLGRALFDKRIGLIAALLLATFPPHLAFSRLGLNNIADPLFGTLALAFLAQGIRYNRRMKWALGGVMLGLTHYFYEAGRLVYTPLVIVWLVGLWLLSRTPYRMAKKPAGESKWRYVPSAVLGLIVVAAPVYITLYGMNRPVAARLVTNNVGLDADYWQAIFQPDHLQQHLDDHIIPAFAVYTTQPDDTLFYGGNAPLLILAVAPFFLLGLACLVWRWRTPGALLLLLWLVGTSLGNSLVLQSAAYTRFVLVFPALMLITAIGVGYGLPMIFGTAARRHWALRLVAGISIVLALLQAYNYFAIHIQAADDAMRASWPHPDAEDAILRSLDFPTGTGIHLISKVPADQNYDNAILHFMRPDLTLDTLSPDGLSPDYFHRLSCGLDQAFFVQLDDWDTLSKLRSEFYLRQPQLSPYSDITPQQQYILYYAPYWPGNDRPFPNRCSPPS